MKLRQISLKNFRGVREIVSIDLKNNPSFLLYGDNGTGKSSFADGVEWFLTDKVDYLRGEEIEKHGGLRNILCKDTDECCVQLDLNSGITAKKTLNYKKGKIESTFIDQASKNLADSLSQERILIRNAELLRFIFGTKKDRLDELYKIIGFESISATTAVLKSVANKLRTMLRTKNFEAMIAEEARIIADKLHATVNTTEQFYAAVNLLLEPLRLEFQVQDNTSCSKAIEILKEGVDQKEFKLKTTVELCSKAIMENRIELVGFSAELATLVKDLSDLHADEDYTEQLSLHALLQEGERLLMDSARNACPLCEQPINREVLIVAIKERVASLKQAQQRIATLTQSKEVLLTSLSSIFHGLTEQLKMLKELSISSLDLAPAFESLDSIKSLRAELSKSVTSIDTLKLSFSGECVKVYERLSTDLIALINTTEAVAPKQKVEYFYDVSSTKNAFKKIMLLKAEKTTIEAQRNTIEKILSEFINTQRNEMQSFLSGITTYVNEYFLFMNTEDRIDELELRTLDNSDGEFSGISIQFKFHGQPAASPRKYLSESYLDCLGLCIFLASVRLFNQESQFFILDDVISSFDKQHRLRFSQLLDEKFSDYQILVFTHESEWFDLMANVIKGKNWSIRQIHWDEQAGGTIFELPAKELRQQIIEQIRNNDVDGLGNRLRRYTERSLKELCACLKAKVLFRFNDDNEKRMADELFSSLRGKLKEKTDLHNNAVVTRLSTSKFIGNITSHDSAYHDNIHDIKAAFDDLIAFESLLLCSICKQSVHVDNFNKATNTISCNCGSKQIAWKE